MVAGLLLLLLFALTYAGFACLALSQRRNWQVVMGATPLPRRRAAALRIGGGLLFTASLLIAIQRDGPAFGAILWTVMLTITAALVVLTLTWRARS